MTKTHVKPFAEIYKKEVDNLKKLFEGYVQSVLAKTSAPDAAPTSASLPPSPMIDENGNVILKGDLAGFPILPENWKQDCGKKATMERLWTTFMNKHYGNFIIAYSAVDLWHEKIM